MLFTLMQVIGVQRVLRGSNWVGLALLVNRIIVFV